jgi:hypothetical protein
VLMEPIYGFAKSGTGENLNCCGSSQAQTKPSPQGHHPQLKSTDLLPSPDGDCATADAETLTVTPGGGPAGNSTTLEICESISAQVQSGPSRSRQWPTTLSELGCRIRARFISFEDSGKIIISPELTANARAHLGVNPSMCSSNRCCRTGIGANSSWAPAEHHLLRGYHCRSHR